MPPRDFSGRREIFPGVIAYDFSGPRIDVMNEEIVDLMRSDSPTEWRDGANHLNRGTREKGFFHMEPMPACIASLQSRLMACLDDYLETCRPDLIGAPYRQVSWSNHYAPTEGVPWHDHVDVGAQVIAVYCLQSGERGDFLFRDPDNLALAHIVPTPMGRTLFMAGDIWHCTSPNFGPEFRVTLPVDFMFEEDHEKPKNAN